MDRQEVERRRSLRLFLSRAGLAVFLCLCIGAAVIHANLRYQSRYEERYLDAGPYEVYSVGWPVLYGGQYSNHLWPVSITRVVEMRWVAVDLIVAAVLVLSPLAVLRRWRSCETGATQFTLAGLFSLTTAVAMVLSLLTLERAYGWASEGERWPGVYSALGSHPWYDQAAIGAGLVCALYLAIVALSQVFKSLAAHLRGPQRK
jgi:hypothetical protein